MIVAVVPVRNEEKRLKKTFKTLLSTPVKLIVAVINGSTDNSLLIAQQFQPRVLPIYFDEPLGIDVPRAIGAKIATDRGAKAVLFIDGDMDGDIGKDLCQLLNQVISCHHDISLTNCYPGLVSEDLSLLAAHLLKERRQLNQKIGLQSIGAASPCHGPHIVSRRFLDAIPLQDIAIPPVSLALAAKNRLRVNVGANVSHKDLGSPEKDQQHSQLIAETIIGDCIEALHAFRDEKRIRLRGQYEYNGYHSQRRWDILDKFIRNK
ncbi:MAG: glycosyltransferase family A protein [Desulfotomaculaceae bacterium]|nr:glycosyltransferase family A protein [Desulfotomaculaceae bacterium]